MIKIKVKMLFNIFLIIIKILMMIRLSKLISQFSSKVTIKSGSAPTVKSNKVIKENPVKIKSPNQIKTPPFGNVKGPSKIEAPKTNNLIDQFMTKTEEKQIQVKLEKKCPVITIMGHVDHGKTTLLDFLRKSNIAEKEDGGITQRIGAFSVNYNDNKLTFIDTPGHQAFSNMRKRGASLTDLIILVVSATEGVKRQTKQVIQIIKEDQIPVVVAINKLDIPKADPEEVQKQIQQAGLDLEVFGGNVPIVHISAKTGMNVDLLCELIVEETQNAKAVFEGLAQASVLEAYKSKEGINCMTIIMEKGILNKGSLIVIKKECYKIKKMQNDLGQEILKAFPGDAVQIKGVPSVPQPGDYIFSAENQKNAAILLKKKKEEILLEQKAKAAQKDKVSSIKMKRMFGRQKRAFYRGVAEIWINKFNEAQNLIKEEIEKVKSQDDSSFKEKTLEVLEQKLKDHQKYVYEYLKHNTDSPSNMNIILKFSERGMQETIMMKLDELKANIQRQTGIKLNLIKSDVGDVNRGDISDATVFNAKIFTFGAGISAEAQKIISQEKCSPRVHSLIHNLINDIEEACRRKKIQDIQGVEKGRCRIENIYQLKIGKTQKSVPGIVITSGKISKNHRCYVFRNSLPISDALTVNFLKSFKKDYLELKKDQEGTVNFHEEITFQLEKGDEIVCYE